MEREIGQLEARQVDLEGRLADPAALQGGHEALLELTAEHAAVAERQTELMNRWEELEQKNQG